MYKKNPKLMLTLMVASCLTAPSQLMAGGIVSAGSGTTVYNAPNGVPVVDIAKANASGLSHNKFTDYNVDNRGVVLNNGNSSQISRQSQLAGQVFANMNLTNEAGIILNEVVSTNRSTLAGYTEVLGHTADVIVANPNGITCSGCGFINTPNVTLTTGKSLLNPDGSLAGFDVTGGDILINGTGLNANSQDYLALVARSVKLDGQVNAKILDVVGGANTWDYITRTATAKAPDGNVPLYSIDSSALGGMYANRIRLVATESGVGVHMAGDAAAASDDFTIDADGKVEIASKVSSTHDVKITTTQSGAQAIKTTVASISASHDVVLTASNGEASLSGGLLSAGNDLTLNLASLTDAKTSDSLTNNNKRYASHNLTFNVTGAGSIDGTIWGAGNAFAGSFGSLAVNSTDGATLYSGNTFVLTTAGAMNLSIAYLQAQNDLTLNSTGGAITTAANAAQGVRSIAGNIVLNANNGLTNGGTVTSDVGSLTARIGGTLNNTGTLDAGTIIDIADYSNGATEAVTSSGTVLAADSLTLKGASLNNSGGMQGTKGAALTLGSLTNSGTLILSSNSAYSGTINADSLNNSGTGAVLQSAKDLTLNIRNSVSNDYYILATGNLSLIASNAGSTLSLTNNSGGIIQSGGTLLLEGTGGGNNFTIGTQTGKLLGNDVTIIASGLTNGGTIDADNALSLTNTGNISNSGVLLGENTLLVSTTGTLTNTGTIQGNNSGTLSGATLANTGTITGGTTTGHNGTLTFNDLTNNAGGLIQSAGNLDLTVKNILTTYDKILAGSNLTVRGQNGTLLSLVIGGTGWLQAGNTLDIKGYGGGDQVIFTLQSGKVLGNALSINTTSIANNGVIQGGTGASSFTVTNTLTNNAGGTITLATASGGSGTVNAAAIDNSGTLQSSGSMILNATSNIFARAGAKIMAAGNLTMRGLTAAAYAVHNFGLIQSGGTLDIAGNGGGNAVTITTDGANAAYLGDIVNMNAGTIGFASGVTSKITSDHNMTLTAGTLSMGGGGSAIVGGNSGTGLATINVTNAFTNTGGLFSKGSLTLNVSSLTNGNGTSGGVGATGTLTISSSSNISNVGALYAGTMNISATNTFTNQSTGGLDSSSDMSITADTFINHNNIIAGRDLTITANTFHNDVPENVEVKWNWEGTDFVNEQKPGDQDNRNSANAEDHDAVRDWTVVGHDTHDNGDTTHWYDATFNTYQYYTVTPTHKPELIASRNLTIQNFTTATNIGGIISAPTVKINTTHSGATFTNDDLALETDYWEADYNHYVNCDFAGNFCDTTYYRSYNKSITSISTTSFGAGIFAGSLQLGLVGQPFSMVNKSSAYNAGSTGTSSNPGNTAPTGTGSTALGATTGTTTGAGATGGATGASGSGGISFGGITVTLPSNPNGFFVVSQDPNSKYLVETNPLYGAGSNFVGSDYLADRLGIDPDDIQRRLGDADYEASLIREQLIQQTGSNIIINGENEAQQMQRLMDQGADQASALGLTFGTAPTAAQLANLKQDMVWMVSTMVNGQEVLAPVVYLCEATKQQIQSGAIIAANDISANLTSLTNTGGTITGKNSLNIASQGDIINTGGQIGGGNVILASTSGSIVNQTVALDGGGTGNNSTVIGKTAGITATGNLSLSAGQDIANKGAQMSAGGNASLTAGHDITFDTIVDNESKTTHSGSGNGTGGLLGTGSNTTTVDSSSKNIKSGLTVGGDLTTHSGNDTTFAGTDVKVGGNADLDAGGNLNIISREDSETHSTETSSGNALSGSTDKHSVTNDTNVGSTFTVGGNLKTNSTGDTIIQGSDINVAGNGDIHAGGDFKILDGQNANSTTDSHSSTGIGQGGGVYGTESDDDTQVHTRSVASNLNFGGNATIGSDKDLTVQGSNITTGGDIDLNAKNINILEGRNTDTETHTHSSTGFLSIENGGSGDSSSGSGSDAGTDGASAGAHAHAEAGASGEAGVNLMKTETTTTTHYKSTGVGSNIKSGGNTTMNADNDITIRGSNVDSGGDVNLNGSNVNILASEDIDTTTTTKSTTGLGLYGSSDNKASASAGADAKADAADASADKKGVNAGGANASAGADADANASSENTLDLMHTTQTSTTSTDITHQGSSIHSGGNMNVNAKNKLNVVGSDLAADGDANLNATDMSFTAAQDSHTTTTNTSTTKLGLYADAGANAHAGAHTSADSGDLSVSGDASASADANAGVGLQGTNTTSSHTEGSTTARVSTIKSGGNMTRTATNNITDEGTDIEAGGDFTQSSKTWDSKAAKNTTFSSDSSETNTARIGLYAEANAGASAEGSAGAMGTSNETDSGADASVGVSASYHQDKDSSSSNSSQAVVSNIKSGGKMKTTTTGKTSLEGTNLESGGDMELNAGELDFKAAQDTESSSSGERNIDAGGKIGIDASKAVTGTLSGGYDNTDKSESSTHAVTGSMKSGGNLKVNTKGDAHFEGTNIAAEGDAGIDAGGSVKFDAAHDTHTSSEDSQNASASISASKSKGGGSAKGGESKQGVKAEGGFSHEEESSDDAVVGSITSGGKLSVKAGKDATFTGTQLDAGGDASVEAGGDVSFNAAKSTSSSTSYGMSASLDATKGSSDGGKKSSKGGNVGLEGNYSQSDSSTSTVAGIKSGGNLTLKSGHDTNLEGTNIESTGKTSIVAGNNVNIKAATDTSTSFGVEASLGGGKSSETTTGADGKKTTEKKSSASGSIGVEGSDSTTKTGAAIKAGSLDISAGNDANLEGTQIDTKGDTNIGAMGNVNLTTAKSTSIDGSFGGGAETSKEGDKSEHKGGVSAMGIGGQSDEQGVGIKTGGNLTIASGGTTSMTGTQADVGGSADIEAGEGIDKSSAVSGGGQIGLTRAGANLDVQGTEIDAKGGTTENGAAAGVKAVAEATKNLANIVNQASTPAAVKDAQAKVQKQMDAIKNDKSMTPDQKKAALAQLQLQQDNLSKKLQTMESGQ